MELLIGHTGFVGSTLARGLDFAAQVNSTTIDDAAGREFDLVVNCGVSAEKWRANMDPEADRAGIAKLTAVLGTIKAKHVVHISTVDVFGTPSCADESTIPAREGLHAYGRHRLDLEDFMRSTFPSVQVIRLPGLFGEGLKKNAIFDLMNDNCLSQINPGAAFQWYPMSRLAEDLRIALDAGMPLLHLTSEPVRTAEIVSRFFPNAAVGPEAFPAPRYDIRSKFAGLFGGRDGYMLNKDAVLQEIGRFIRMPADA